MTRPPRMQTGHDVYILRNTTARGHLWLRPDPDLVALFRSRLIYYARRHRVLLCGAGIMRDGWWAAAAFPRLNRDAFARDFQREFSRAVRPARSIGAGGGSLYADRYDCRRLLGAQSIFDWLVRLHCLPVEHGLVDRPEQWPGLISLEALAEATPLETDWAPQGLAGKEVRQLELWLPPRLVEAVGDEQTARQDLVDAIATTSQSLVDRREEPAVGAERALAVDPWHRSTRATSEVGWTDEPCEADWLDCPLSGVIAVSVGASSDDEADQVAQAVDDRFRRYGQYRCCIRLLRLNRGELPWPHGMHPPGWTWCCKRKRDGPARARSTTASDDDEAA